MIRCLARRLEHGNSCLLRFGAVELANPAVSVVEATWVQASVKLYGRCGLIGSTNVLRSIVWPCSRRVAGIWEKGVVAASFRSQVKQLLNSRLPTIGGAALFLWRYLRPVPELYSAKSPKLREIAERIITQYGLVVQHGPFAGLQYIRDAIDSQLVPKLLGAYEAELHDAFTGLIKAGHKVVINIGCAEGYYAVGLARTLPDARVYAFDPDPHARKLCRKLATQNGVADRISFRGFCSIGRLRALTKRRALIVCDCEGCELGLLRPDLIPGLRFCDLIVELHDFINPETSSTVLSRFEGTHWIKRIRAGERDAKLYPAIAELNPADQHLALSEFRPSEMEWAVMEARATRP